MGFRKTVFSYWFQKCIFDLNKKSGQMYILKSVWETVFLIPQSKKKIESHRKGQCVLFSKIRDTHYFEKRFYINRPQIFIALPKRHARKLGAQITFTVYVLLCDWASKSLVPTGWVYSRASCHHIFNVPKVHKLWAASESTCSPWIHVYRATWLTHVQDELIKMIFYQCCQIS